MSLLFLLAIKFAQTMQDDAVLIEKLYRLPAHSRLWVDKFIDFLLTEANRTDKALKPKKRSGFGSWKGIRLSADFDAPLDDFKEYME